MAKDKRKKSKGNKKLKLKLNNKVFKILIPVIACAILAYVIYSIIELILVPTEMTLVENGTISQEETAIRIYNKG